MDETISTPGEAIPQTTVADTLRRIATTANGTVALLDDVFWKVGDVALVAAETDRLAALLRTLLMVLLEGGHRVDGTVRCEAGGVTFELRRGAVGATLRAPDRSNVEMAHVRLALARRVAEIFGGAVEVEWQQGEARMIRTWLPSPG